MTRRSTPPKPVPTAPRYPIGTLLESWNMDVSQLELDVAAKLVEAGVALREPTSIQCDFDPVRQNFPILTPDILIDRAAVCVEIDTKYTHAEKDEDDRSRDALLAGVGWTVVRLRLGGLEPLGPHDVVAESGYLSKAVIEALVEAVSDAVAGRPGRNRRLKSRPTAPRPKSRLGALSEHQYYDNAFYCAWTPAGGEVLRLVVMDYGRYLAAPVPGHGVPQFLHLLNLHETPRAKWRPVLESILDRMTDFEPVSLFPWGDQLFVGEQAHTIRTPPKFHPGMWGQQRITTNLVGVEEWDPEAIFSGENVIVQLHPELINRGWEFTQVELRTGIYGDYQVVIFQRFEDGDEEETTE